MLNFVGGCCGTFPSHLAAVMKKCEGVAPRKLPEQPNNPMGSLIDVVNAVAAIRKACLCVSFSDGLSNLSFALRVLNSVCDAMHSGFLYYAVPQGLNVSIVKTGGLPRYQDIEPKARQMCEEVLLNKPDEGNHGERFFGFAESVKNGTFALAAAPAGPALTIAKSTATQQNSPKCTVKRKSEHVQTDPDSMVQDVCRVQSTIET
eukprot:7379899-Heterocapsa_arctica.AAC.1